MKTKGSIRLGSAVLVAMAGVVCGMAQVMADTPRIEMQLAQSADAKIARPQGDVAQGTRGPVTNLPVPRYVSLKGSEGNARRGPSLSHRIDWVFRHAGMPLRVTAEFGHWRRVEDKDGAGGWIHYALLSGVRTALVTQDMLELRSRPDPDSNVVARAESGAIVRLGECDPGWCRISGGGQRGWVPKSAIWGVDPDEVRE
ncbi:SH3 domain-containing protein [Paracoccus sp. 11-3]|uniref:SH3 domain-containing protein n=1 Tax=Paracoccus amoyensis TaxID=2760093 RepID=A0A926G8Q9_9RHOB|nr:SH3 domain-containing protein [Paracoccus amoyensis]MBC9245361.1 SH3 domain-containing protein [Paracoccus amoyensis]